MKKIITTILCFVMILSCGYKPQAKTTSLSGYEIYVSPEGNDSASGNIDSPVKTLEKAKMIAVEMAKTAKSDVTVFLREGSYNPGTGLMFSETDSGTDDSVIRFKAYNGEKVSVSNAVILDNTKFSVVTDEKVLNRIPAEARGKIYSIDLPANGIKNLGEIRRAGMGSEYQNSPDSRMLIIDESRFTLARWPNGGFATIKEVFNSTGLGGHLFSYKENKGSGWLTATEPWVSGYFRYYWADDSLPVQKIDAVNKTILTKGTAAYNVRHSQSFFIFNLLEELDIPGEWFLDSATGVLYVYPKSDINKAQVKFAPNTEELVTMTGAKNISFEDIIFEDTCGTAVRMKDCENVVFDNCEFRNIGQRAVFIDSGYNCGVKNSYVHDTGKGGIYMEGGDDVNFTPSNNFVDNCHIERYSFACRTYSSAVKLYGVGNRMSHCMINDGTHLAVQYNGIDNVAEYNEIYNVLKESHDAGAFYGGRTWTSKVTFRNNYIHDSGNKKLLSDDVWMTQAIYADDGMVGLHIYNNIIDNLFGGISLHYGRHSYIKNNYILNTQRGVRINCWNGDTDMEDLGKRNENVKNLFLEQGIDGVKGIIEGTLYNSYVNAKNKNWDLYLEKFPWLDTIAADELHFPKYNEMSGNIFVNSGEYDWNFLPEEGNTRENNYVTDTFTSYEELASHVPGFEPIDINEIGLREKENKPVGNFRALGPANGATEVSSEYVSLVWEPSEGASNYELVVAEDSEFKNIVLHENLTDTYRLLPKLKSGGQKYYWKVSATSVSDNYTDVAVPNSNGVQSFRTKIKEPGNTENLAKIINESWNCFDSATEAKDGGKYLDGSKESFKKRIQYAESFLSGETMKSPYIGPQNSIDNAMMELKNFQSAFINSQVPQTVDIKGMLAQKDGWAGSGILATGNKLEWSTPGNVGYKTPVETFKKLKFKASFTMSEIEWVSVGLRVGQYNIAPWSTTGYVFLVKHDVVELQKFGNAHFIHTVPNDFLQSGTEHDIEFGAVNDTDGGVRVTLVVDGKEIFNVLDTDKPIYDMGYFAFYSAGAPTITLRSAE